MWERVYVCLNCRRSIPENKKTDVCIKCKERIWSELILIRTEQDRFYMLPSYYRLRPQWEFKLREYNLRKKQTESLSNVDAVSVETTLLGYDFLKNILKNCIARLRSWFE